MVTLRRRRRARRSRGHRRLRGDGGLAIVELAIVVPLLALIAAGTIEFGFAWRDSLTVSNATRAAARVVSNLGTNRLADYEALLTLRAGLATLPAGTTIDGVLIYDATAADGEPPAQCFDSSGAPKSVNGMCNAYSAADLAGLSLGDFGGTTSCSSSALDRAWCPTSRQDQQSLGLDDVGVWVQVDRGWLTRIFPGSGITFDNHTVMRIEPAT